MPTYVFRIQTENENEEPVNVELQNEQEVRQEAVRTATGFMREHGPVPVEWAIEAKAEDGSNVARVRFSVE